MPDATHADSNEELVLMRSARAALQGIAMLLNPAEFGGTDGFAEKMRVLADLRNGVARLDEMIAEETRGT